MPEPERTGSLSAAGTIAVIVATLSFLPIVQGTGWWTLSIVFCAVAVAVSAGSRALGATHAASAILGLTTIPMLATAVDGAGQGLLLVLPTTASSLAVNQTLTDAAAQIYADTVPAGATPGIELLIAAGAATAAVLVDLVAVGLRAPLPAMLIVLALAIVPGKALRTGTNGWLLVAVAAAVLLVIGADRWRRGAAPRLSGLAGGGALALVLALLAQVVLPAPLVQTAEGLPLQPLFGPGADPLIRLGDNLRRGPKTPVLSYETTSKQDVYLRLAVLEDFTGSTWSPQGADRFAGDTAAPSAPGLVKESAARTAVTRVTAADESAIGDRLPLPYPAERVLGVQGFAWDSHGLTLLRRDQSAAIEHYTVVTAEVDASAKALRGATTSVPSGDPETLRMPKDVPTVVRQTADSWTGAAGTPYAKALAIQNHLRGGAFLYDEQTPAQNGYDGDGLGVIAKFLQVKAGYCVHFASTMAVMARLEGIPARVVVGYQPGERTVVDSTATYSVSSDDLHAWPELYFDGIGWVRFEPTPGRGAVPTYAPVPQQSAQASVDPKKQRGSAAPTVAPTAGASGANGGHRTDPATVILPVLRGIGIGAGVVVLLLLPALLRVLVRRRRFARLKRAGPADVGWREILDTGADLGLPPPKGLSPRGAEQALRRDLAPRAAPALARVRGAYERTSYGTSTATVAPEDVDAVIEGFRDRASLPARVRATLAPRSLLLRTRPAARPPRARRIGSSRLAFRWNRPPGSD